MNSQVQRRPAVQRCIELDCACVGAALAGWVCAQWRAVKVVVRIDFEIRVAGEVPAQVLADLQNGYIVRRGVETVLRGPVEDQAALVGLINWLQMLGVELREVRQIAASGPDAAGGHLLGHQ